MSLTGDHNAHNNEFKKIFIIKLCILFVCKEWRENRLLFTFLISNDKLS